MNHKYTLYTVAATLTALTAPAANAQTLYSNLAAFNTAAPGTTNNDFEGIADANNFVTNPAVLVTPATGRVTFSVTGDGDANVYAADSGFNGGADQLSDGTDSVVAGRPNTSASTTTITLGGSYTAFAIEYGMEVNAANAFSFALFSGNTQVGTAQNVPSLGGDRFFGVISDTAFDNVRVTAAQTGLLIYVTFDNARVGSVVVPEAGTLALALPALALGAAVITRRRRK